MESRFSFGEMQWRERAAREQREESKRLAREAMLLLCAALITSAIFARIVGAWM